MCDRRIRCPRLLRISVSRRSWILFFFEKKSDISSLAIRIKHQCRFIFAKPPTFPLDSSNFDKNDKKFWRETKRFVAIHSIWTRNYSLSLSPPRPRIRTSKEYRTRESLDRIANSSFPWTISNYPIPWPFLFHLSLPVASFPQPSRLNVTRVYRGIENGSRRQPTSRFGSFTDQTR